MEKERVGSLCVVVTVQVKIAKLVQVPVWGNKLSYQVIRRQVVGPGRSQTEQLSTSGEFSLPNSQNPCLVMMTALGICGALGVWQVLC